MLAKVLTCAVVGLDGVLVEVEVDIGPGLPRFDIVGLPDAAVQEARDRVRAAVRNSGCSFPGRRITANLAPGDLRKAGPSYDLPIALGVVLASGQALASVDNVLFLGELALDGALRPTDGVLAMVAFARGSDFHTVYVPEANAAEAALVDGVSVMPVRTLSQLIAHLNGQQEIIPYVATDAPVTPVDARYQYDMSDIKGQEHAKRALEIAASGGHNVLMSGAPGTGKTLLARAMPSILPAMSFEEALESTKIYSIAGMLPAESPLINQRPFRSPHHTVSTAGLVGGGGSRLIRPGEVTLAHRGVLFLDELPEFNRIALEALRQPIEDKVVTVTRAMGSLTFPANFIFIAAMNPCPCGWHGDAVRECTCGPAVISRYQKRISGPLLDRIDLCVEVPRVDYEKLTDDRRGEPSSAIRARVEAARARQRSRLKDTRLTCNAEMGPAEVRLFCKSDPAAQALLKAAMSQLQLSGRAFHRILKLARTVADLAGADIILSAHLAEALQYRQRSELY